jgi:ABC-type transporter Mla subunit MlaD
VVSPTTGRQNHVVAKNSRVPSAVGSIPLVGDLVKQADSQAQWLQDLVEQNARLVGQLPATMKTFNDSIERFNQTVGRLDRMVTQVEAATNQLVMPMQEIAPRLEKLVAAIDVNSVRELPGVLDSLRKEALPALRAATDTQKQLALLTSTVERIVALLGELPGAGIVRRLAGGATRPDDSTD